MTLNSLARVGAVIYGRHGHGHCQWRVMAVMEEWSLGGWSWGISFGGNIKNGGRTADSRATKAEGASPQLQQRNQYNLPSTLPPKMKDSVMRQTMTLKSKPSTASNSKA